MNFGNIYFVGLMGSGKSSVGKLLAKTIRFNFVDLDSAIEQKYNITISGIFAQYGEAVFRDMETNMLEEIAKEQQSFVVATGGGCVERESNRNFMKKHGIRIFLDVDIASIINRICYNTNSHRPMLMGKSPEECSEKLEFLYKKRYHYYLDSEVTFYNQENVPQTVTQIQRYLLTQIVG